MLRSAGVPDDLFVEEPELVVTRTRIDDVDVGRSLGGGTFAGTRAGAAVVLRRVTKRDVQSVSEVVDLATEHAAHRALAGLASVRALARDACASAGSVYFVFEAFGTYSLGDVDGALGVLAGHARADLLLDPLFLAADPNLLWPLLHFYGSVHNALRRFHPNGAAAPDTATPPAPLAPAVADGVPAIAACGNDACRELARESDLKRCARCRARAYCSAACQRADWPAHKRECAACAAAKKK